MSTKEKEFLERNKDREIREFNDIFVFLQYCFDYRKTKENSETLYIRENNADRMLLAFNK